MTANSGKIKEYLDNAKLYFTNSDKLFKKKEYSKAGELLWGAIAETVKALSMTNGKPINTHNDLRKLLEILAIQKQNRGFTIDLNKAANDLHVNFYETFLSENDFKTTYTKGHRLLILLQQLIFNP